MEESEERSPSPAWLRLFVLALAAGGVACIACGVWRDAVAPAPPWPAAHAGWCGLIVFAAALVVGRVWLFMRRLEAK